MRRCFGCGERVPAGADCLTCQQRAAQQPVRLPATVTTAQVLVVLSGIGGLLWSGFSIVAGITATTLGSTIDQTGSIDVGPLGISSVAGAGHALIVVGLLNAVLAVVELRCCARLGRADPGARGVLAAVYAIDLIATVVLAVVEGPEYLTSLTIAVPWAVLVLGLIWLPESSRAAFGDTPQPTAHNPNRHSPPRHGSRTQTAARAPVPMPRPTGDRWADERMANVDAFCGQCGRRNDPPRQHCAQCGSRLNAQAPRA